MSLTVEQLETLFEKKIAKINGRYVIFIDGIKCPISKIVTHVTDAAFRAHPEFGVTVANMHTLIPSSLGLLDGYSIPVDYDSDIQYFSGLVPIIDMVTAEKKMATPETWEIMEDSYDACMEILPKELRKIPLPVYFEFNPYDVEKFRSETRAEGIKNIINLYKCPSWRKVTKYSSSLPVEAEKFFLHLFPDPISREYCFFWIKNAIISRNESILVLNGSKGIGKGVLATLIKYLVGMENYSEAPKSLLKSDFNSVLRNKRVIFFDEFNIRNGQDHDFLKKIANEFQTIERKGIDADKTEKIFNSYIIANNDATDMYVEWDDRRFSVVEMTDTDLRKTMTEQEIQDFCTKKVLDESFLAAVGNFILSKQYNPSFTTHSPLKTKRFYEMAFNSLAIWQKFLVEKWESGSTQVSLDSVKKDFENKNGKEVVFPANSVKIRDFFKNYRHNGVDAVGSIFREPNSKKWFLDFQTKVEDIL